MVDDVTTNIETIRAEAQQTLDELFADNLIPFKLTARVVESIGMDEYIVRFHDSRLYSIDVSWRAGQTFKAVFRASILERVVRLKSSPMFATAAPRTHNSPCH